MLRLQIYAALRSLLRSPGFVLLVVPVLALALAGAISTWAIIESVLLKPLPYGDSDRLVLIGHDHVERGVTFGGFSLQDFSDINANVGSIGDVSAYLYWPGQTTVNAIVDGVAIEAATTFVSENFFKTFRVSPSLGRTLMASDAAAHDQNVVFVSHSFWQRALAGKPSAIGSSLTIDGAAYTIVGIAPSVFTFPSPEVSFWLPLKAAGREQLDLPREFKWLDVAANLKEGVTLGQAKTELDSIFLALSRQFPHANEGFDRAHVAYVLDSVVGRDRKWIVAVLVATVLLVVVAYINLGGMLYARVIERSKDAAIQSALGAQSRRIAAQSVLSAMLIALVASLIALAASWALIHLVFQRGLIEVSRAQEITLPLSLVGAAMISAILVAAIAALIPVKRILAIHPAGVMSGSSSGRSRFRAANALAVIQMALVLAITYGATAMVLSSMRLQDVSLGLRTENVLSVRINLQRQGDGLDEWQTRTIDELVQAVSELPQTQSVTAAATSPLSGEGERYGINVGVDEEDWVNPEGGYVFAGANYFEVLNVRVIAGQAFTGREVRTDAEAVPMVVNRAFVRKYFRGDSNGIIGRKLATGIGETVRIVGVVGDILHSGPALPPKPTMYLPQHLFPRPNVTLLIAAHASDSRFAEEVRRAVARVVPLHPISNLEWMRETAGKLTSNNRLVSAVLTAFAGVALLVVGIGLYSLLTITFTARRKELAIRKALGATDLQLYSVVIRRALALAWAGMGLGLPLCVVTTTYLAGFLFQTERFDYSVLALIALFASFLAVLAAIRPAHRVLSSDTSATLRST